MSMISPHAAPVIALCLTWVSAPASAQSIDQSFYYKLSTEFRGIGMKLDVFNSGPKNNFTRLESEKNVTGELWRLRGNGDGTFRLSTKFRGANMCLDIFNGGPNNNQPHPTKSGQVRGSSQPRSRVEAREVPIRNRAASPACADGRKSGLRAS